MIDAARQRAQALCARARQHLVGGDRIAALDLSREALRQDSDCFDAHLILAGMALAGDHYMDLLAAVHQNLRPRTYLEIGVGSGASIVLAGAGTLAIGVDPEPEINRELPPSVRILKQTSDEFFAQFDLRKEFRDLPLELAFIDGMHRFEYALRDFINIEKRSGPGTVVFFHDCYPLNEATATRERGTKFWTGDIWKLTLCLKKYRPDLRVVTLAARPTGLGLILGLDSNSTVLSDNLDRICDEFIPLPYAVLESDKRGELNLFPGDMASLGKLLHEWRRSGAGAPAQGGVDAPRLLQEAYELHSAGRLGDAEALYRRVLDADPNNPDALGLLGRVFHQAGRHAAAAELLEKAVRLRPANPFSANYLGEACRSLGNAPAALAMFGRAVELMPDYLEAQLNLAMALAQAGRPADSEARYREILSRRPDSFQAHSSLGALLQNLGRHPEAEASYRASLALAPAFTEAQNNLGNLLRALGRLEEAESCYRGALVNGPLLAEVHSNLGAVLADLGRLAEAEPCYRQALALNPGFAGVYDNLGLLLMRLGRHEEAEQCYRQALALAPQDAEAYGNLVALLNYVPGRSAKEIYAEHREFARRFSPRAEPAPHANHRDPERKLRVGYVSGDFRDHSVAFFIEPVLASHDRDLFDVVCYYNFARTDPVTERLKSLVSAWRNIAMLSDDVLAQVVRDDSIDILVDLSGHTAYNRLLAFARKPAPVQATWLGYLNTTGLDSMDYRITDARACPPGPLDELHSEELLRLPDSQWCYRPAGGAPRIAAMPAGRGGGVTFGALTNLAKISAATIDLWSRLLLKAPQSRLRLGGKGMSAVESTIRSRFARNGIAADRVELAGHGPFQEYLASHSAIDIILDTFPYTGGTTTCHALWMGVPVVTLVGDTATSRGGASILSAVGLQDLIAESPESYVEIAAELAADLGRLEKLRSGMRKRIKSSALMDEPRFTRNLEIAYRSMWRQWCRTAR